MVLGGGFPLDPSRRRHRLWIRFILLSFVSVGVGMLFLGGRGLALGLRSRAWPTAQGSILSSQVDTQSSSDGTTYAPKVTYAYEAGGGHRSGSLVHGGGPVYISSQKYAQAIVDRYPQGAKVSVHYDPRDPSLSVLEPGIHWESLLLPGVGAGFFLVGLWVMVVMERNKVR